MLVNRDGQRFVNEVTGGVTISTTVVDQEGGTPFLIFDESVRHPLSIVETYLTAGFVIMVGSILEVAELLEIDPAPLVEIINHFKSGTSMLFKTIRETALEQGETNNKLKNAKSLLDILDDETISERIELPLETVQELRRPSLKTQES